MIYGIENISLDAPFSFLFSIILFFGVIFVGFFSKILIKKIKTYKFINYNIFFSPIIGIYLIIFFIIHYFNF